MRTIDAIDAVDDTPTAEINLDPETFAKISVKYNVKIDFEVRDDGGCEIWIEPIEADRPQGWTPCSERLPEPESWAIWCSVKGIIQVARWKEDAIDHFFPDQGFFQLDDAVAWMPLPEPYKEQTEREGE